jgi:beta-glucanase (GH16 family)
MGEDKPAVGWPACGEIDVMEYVGRNPTTAIGTIHGPTTTGGHWYLHTETRVSAPLSSKFHVYAVQWGPGGMRWSLDGKVFSEVTKAQAEKQGRWVFDKRFFLLLNLAIGGDLGGPVPAATPFPQRYLVDYVRVYQ